MNTLQSTVLMVKCPHCGNKFTPEDAIGHDIRRQLEKEFDEKLVHYEKTLSENIRKQESERYKNHFNLLEQDRKAKAERLRELEAAAIAVEKREMIVKAKEDEMELEMKRRLLEREKIISQEAEKRAVEKVEVQFREREQKLQRERESLELMMQKRLHEVVDNVREEERLRAAELQKKLDDQSKLIHEMKRRAEQGSMQMQGEIQELAIEDFLERTFPIDQIEEISKGKRGGDCVHIVRDHYGRVCGKILYESKRTKHFSVEWIGKLKDDMRAKQADLGVIVTEALPEGMTRFGERDGIWVCSFPEFKALALLFRHNLARIGEVLAAQENKGDKMQMVYTYVTGTEFKQKLEAAFESYNEMQEDLVREKTLLMTQWAKREKKLLKAMENLIALYGDVKGIAGGAVQEIKSLEIPRIELLYNQ
ncbi:MAG TPA: DUF2130 domain-containing protein [Chryseosolibacter sp.]|nr:DUF2130 domain-containing protein [Chryseosolibacter sp.]